MTTISPCESLLLLQELSWKFRNFHSIHLLSSSAAFSIFSSHSSHQPRRPSRLPTLFELSQKNSRSVEKRETLRANRSSRAELSTHKKKWISRVGGRKEKGMKENGAATTTSLRALRVLFIRYFFLTPFAFFEISLLCFMFYVFSSAWGGCEKRERGFFYWRFSFFFIFGCCLCMLESTESRKIQRKNGDGMLEEANKVSAIKTR